MNNQRDTLKFTNPEAVGWLILKYCGGYGGGDVGDSGD
jgi:hypothetical protein